jgi:hypothetical protein
MYGHGHLTNHHMLWACYPQGGEKSTAIVHRQIPPSGGIVRPSWPRLERLPGREGNRLARCRGGSARSDDGGTLPLNIERQLVHLLVAALTPVHKRGHLGIPLRAIVAGHSPPRCPAAGSDRSRDVPQPKGSGTVLELAARGSRRPAGGPPPRCCGRAVGSAGACAFGSRAHNVLRAPRRFGGRRASTERGSGSGANQRGIEPRGVAHSEDMAALDASSSG